MSYVLTLVASPENPDVTQGLISTISEIIEIHKISYTCAPVWLRPLRAVDLGLSDKLPAEVFAGIRQLAKPDRIDVFMTEIDHRQKKLLVADMDATIVEGETLDELAEYAGLREKIALITQEAMEGKLDFASALRERVGLLKGMHQDALQHTLDKTRLNQGAQALVATMKKNGATCVLVSGGFNFFTRAIAKQAGFDINHGNELDVERNELTGKVKEPILDKQAKVDFMKQYTHHLSLKEHQTMAIGDGANDIPMLRIAGLGIGYRPKPMVAEQIQNLVLYGDLTAALYAQGYTDQHIIDPTK